MLLRQRSEESGDGSGMHGGMGKDKGRRGGGGYRRGSNGERLPQSNQQAESLNIWAKVQLANSNSLSQH
jgi:hypothetical protein